MDGSARLSLRTKLSHSGRRSVVQGGCRTMQITTAGLAAVGAIDETEARPQ